MVNERLKLGNQLCFPVYALSRLITQLYQPLLENLGITYPQYLALLVLWETDGIPVSEITRRLILNTNTLTPVLKRLEAQGLITRQRSQADERKVIISLTHRGRDLQAQAAPIPEKLVECLVSNNVSGDDLKRLKAQLEQIMQNLETKTE